MTADGIEAVQPRVRARRLSGIRREQVFAVVSPLVLLVLWEIFTRTGILDERVFSRPTTVAQIMWDGFTEGELLEATAITLQRLALGMVVGAVPGLVLGLVMGLSRTANAIINPIIAATYPLPRVAMFPLVLLVLGLNETSIVVMVALGPFFTMVISTTAAVMNVDPIYLRVARSFKVRGMGMYRMVLLPAALPIIFSGIRLSLGLALLGVIAAEFLVADTGLGYVIWHSWQLLSLPESMAGLITAGLVGFVLFLIQDVVERFAMPYRTDKDRR